MNRCVAAPLLLLAGVVPAQDEVRAFVEVEPRSPTVYRHQRFDVVLRFGFDVTWFAEAAVPLLAQPLDVPFVIVVPWFSPATDIETEVVENEGGPRVAVGERVQRLRPGARRRLQGRAFEVLELTVRCVGSSAGTIDLPPARLRYAFATRFDDDFLRGRQPVDRQEHTVVGPACRVTVQPLPEPAPVDFSGAVGAYSVRAAVEVRTVAVGDTFAWSLTVVGDGSLEHFAPPPWPVGDGFVVQGLVEQRTAAERRFVFDVLALRTGVMTLPPIPFVTFVPADGAYRVLRTEAAALTVLAAMDETRWPPVVHELVLADRRSAAAWPLWSWFVLVLAGLGSVALFGFCRRRAARARELSTLRAACLAALPRDATACFAALQRLIQIGLSVPSCKADVVLPRLQSKGGGELAGRLLSVLAKVDAMRFGGEPPPAAEVLAVTGRLVDFARRHR